MVAKLPPALQMTEDDAQKLITAQCHLGTKNALRDMLPYVYKRRSDGTWNERV
jgi:small subunit ribosomal protein SAe